MIGDVETLAFFLNGDTQTDDDVELLLLMCEPASPMTIATAMTAKTMTHFGTGFFFGGAASGTGDGAADPQLLPSQ